MVKMTINERALEECIEYAITDSVLLLQNKIIDITPRDPKRPPKDPSIRVTGNLKRSISHQKVGKYQYLIGTQQNEAEYGRWLEYGTPYMAPRSFLRKGLNDSKDEVLRNFSAVLRKKLMERR